MIDRTINTQSDRHKLIVFVGKQPLPFTVKISDGRSRSIDQNKLYRRWINEAAEQRPGMSSIDIEREWKLLYGIPILAESEVFAAIWEPLDAQLSYEDKIIAMHLIAVTSVMTVSQMKRYLDEIERVCAENGIELTDTEERRSGTIRSRVVGPGSIPRKVSS